MPQGREKPKPALALPVETQTIWVPEAVSMLLGDGPPGQSGCVPTTEPSSLGLLLYPARFAHGQKTGLSPYAGSRKHFKAHEMGTGCTVAHQSGAFIARGWRHLREYGMRLPEDAGLGPPPLVCSEQADCYQNHPGSGQAETKLNQAVLEGGRT